MKSEDTWISEMTIFLSIGIPPEHMSVDQRKRLVVRSRNFCLLNDVLYHKGADGIWQRAVRQFEKSAILRESHVESLEDTMLEKPQPEKYGIAGYGGRQ